MTKLKNHARQLLSMLMCLVMTLALVIPSVSAAGDAPYTITIVPNANTLKPESASDALASRFKAYAIFEGNLGKSSSGDVLYDSDDGKTSPPSAHMLNVTGWGDGISTKNLQLFMNALMTEKTTLRELGVTASSLGEKYNNPNGQAGLVVEDSTSLGTFFRQALVVVGKYLVPANAPYTVRKGRNENLSDDELKETGKIIAEAIVDLNKATAGGNNSALANLFAKIAASESSGSYLYLSSPTGQSAWQEEEQHWTISNLNQAGYYLILDELDSSDSDISKQHAISEYMLAVFGTQYIQIKSSVPTVDKKIVSTDQNGDVNKDEEGNDILLNADNAGIGDRVTFRLTGTLPENLAKYTQGYTYIFHDKLSKGLTLEADTVKVYAVPPEDGEWQFIAPQAGSDGGVPNTNYSLNVNTGDGCSFEIIFNNLRNLRFDEGEITKDWQIIVEYEATLNKDAVVVNPNQDTDRNKNTVHLVYSNDVNDEGSTGTTTEKTVYVYTYGLDVYKIDGTSSSNERLYGAEFALSKEIDGKTYYAVFTASHDIDEIDSAESFEKTTIIYTIAGWLADGEEFNTFTSIENGWDWGQSITLSAGSFNDWDAGKYYLSVRSMMINTVYIKGLDADIEYTLSEKAAPENYAVMADVKFTIEAEIQNTDLTDLDVKSSKRNDVSFPETIDTGYIPVTLSDMPSGYLPGTGGMGTALFYIGGVIMLALGGLHFYRRRKIADF